MFCSYLLSETAPTRRRNSLSSLPINDSEGERARSPFPIPSPVPLGHGRSQSSSSLHDKDRGLPNGMLLIWRTLLVFLCLDCCAIHRCQIESPDKRRLEEVCKVQHFLVTSQAVSLCSDFLKTTRSYYFWKKSLSLVWEERTPKYFSLLKWLFSFISDYCLFCLPLFYFLSLFSLTSIL